MILIYISLLRCIFIHVQWWLQDSAQGYMYRYNNGPIHKYPIPMFASFDQNLSTCIIVGIVVLSPNNKWRKIWVFFLLKTFYVPRRCAQFVQSVGRYSWRPGTHTTRQNPVNAQFTARYFTHRIKKLKPQAIRYTVNVLEKRKKDVLGFSIFYLVPNTGNGKFEKFYLSSLCEFYFSIIMYWVEYSRCHAAFNLHLSKKPKLHLWEHGISRSQDHIYFTKIKIGYYRFFPSYCQHFNY